ncbi:hypothetical protein D910_09646 [Dendroctonus ponderosae]
MTNPENPKTAESIYDFTVRDIKGNDVPLANYKGHVCLIVNVASECGLTDSNYEALNELYDKYGESQGLKILGNINVNGNDAHPLWKYLKYKQGGALGDFIKWNFTKFIVDKEGHVVERHGPTTNPKDIKSLEKYF